MRTDKENNMILVMSYVILGKLGILAYLAGLYILYAALSEKKK